METDRLIYIGDEPLPVVHILWLKILEAHVKGRVLDICMVYKGKDFQVSSDQFNILQ